MGRIIKKAQFESGLSIEERLEALSSTVSAPTASPPLGRVISRESQVAHEETERIFEEARRKALALQQEATALLEAAKEQVAAEKEAGYAAGREEGLAELTERLTDLSRLEAEFLQDIEPQLLALVTDLVEKIIAQVLTETPDVLLSMIRQGLRELASTHMTVRLHPDDFAWVKERESELLSALEGMATLSMRADSRVAPHGCVIESEVGTLDAQLETQLASMKKVLGIKDSE